MFMDNKIKMKRLFLKYNLPICSVVRVETNFSGESHDLVVIMCL